MEAVAGILVAIGIIAGIYAIMMKMKISRISSVPFAKTGEIVAQGAGLADPKGAISTEGKLVCPQPLESPVTGTPCLYYKVEVKAKWKEGETEKSKTLQKDTAAAAFSVDDGTGAIAVIADEGGDFDDMKKSYDQTKKTGLIGGIKGADLEFGNLRVSTGALKLGTRYEVEEHTMPVTENLYVLGKLQEDGKTIGSPKWRSLYLSSKGREGLLGSAGTNFKYGLYVAGGGVGLGAILGIVALAIA